MFIESGQIASSAITLIKTAPPVGTTVIFTDKYPEPHRPWLTVQQAANRIGVSADFLYHAFSVEGLKHVRLAGRRGIRISPNHLDEWMKFNTTSRRSGVK